MTWFNRDVVSVDNGARIKNTNKMVEIDWEFKDYKINAIERLTTDVSAMLSVVTLLIASIL